MEYFYEVTFDTKKNGFNSWIIHVSACNLREARCKVEEMWRARHNAHMFYINVRRLKPTDEFLWHWFHRR